MVENFYTPDVGEQEKFNMGLATLERIHRLLAMCNQIWVSNDQEKFRVLSEVLDGLYREAYPLIVEHFAKDEKLNARINVI